MAGLHNDLEQLHSSYNTFVDHGNELDDDEDESDNESPPLFYGSGQPASNWYHQAQNTDGHHMPKLKKNNKQPHESPGGVIIHTVPEETRSRWSHIEDLDSFFKNVYTYHQKHGFQVMLVQVSNVANWPSNFINIINM